jgi:chromosomal replication initiator protein
LSQIGEITRPAEGKKVDESVPQAAEIWERVQSYLKAEFGDDSFDTWISGLELVTAEGGTVRLSARTKFVRDWIQRHYKDRIHELWAREDKSALAVEIVADPKGNRKAPTANLAKIETGTADSSVVADSALQANLDPRFTFDSFVVGKSNELAYAAASRVAETREVPFNPLFLHGGVGLGKTHLMHAIAQEVKRRRPEAKFVYMSAEKFMFQFISALRYKDTVAFKRQFRSVDLLMIDDVQFIANKNTTQEEFFHTFNALVDNRRQVIISADRSPTDLKGIEERIISRLGWGLVADIHPTDFELRFGILQSKCEQFPDVSFPEEVLELLARRITSNVRELEGGLNRIAAYATFMGRAVTLDMAQDVLQDVLRANDRKVTISEIQRQVVDYYNLRLSELLSARRSQNIARPRQVAMFLAKQLTSRSLPEIGRKFGGRDHTTVMHAVRKIEDLRRMDSSLDEDLKRIRRILDA